VKNSAFLFPFNEGNVSALFLILLISYSSKNLKEGVFMKPILILFISLVATSTFAYQVTGPVVEITPEKIVVQKGKEKWDIKRDASTKVPTNVKVGDKVTVEYSMTAKDIEVKK
jgi:hypothetical protein